MTVRIKQLHKSTEVYSFMIFYDIKILKLLIHPYYFLWKLNIGSWWSIEHDILADYGTCGHLPLIYHRLRYR